MLRQLQTKVDGLEYNADLHTKKIHWLAINYPDVNNHLFETIKTGEIYKRGEEMTTFTTQDRQDAQRTPLTDEKITELWYKIMETRGQANDLNKFARAIERAHGIGE